MLARSRALRKWLPVFLAAGLALVSVAVEFHSHPVAGRWPRASSPGKDPGGVASVRSCPVCTLVHAPAFPTVLTVGLAKPDFAGFLVVPVEPDLFDHHANLARASRAPPTTA